ncbi:DNA polymerase III subunit beta [Alicyclobacillus shizuokensis]|uniref:DNA polymerase III subunit beta n=1 Tax=Alicyclobacillus shizuokensis TaxID=392014 RepID=UPI00082DC658|nr:DNA polymerase III subunit beta [Alicyclobacillus shizuokensis]
MKLTISQQDLLRMLSTVSKAVAVRSPRQVLTGILLEASAERLTATAYDLELGIQNWTNEETEIHIDEPGAIVLPARYFLDAVRKLPARPVTIETTHNYLTAIRSDQVEFHLHGIDAAEFPRLPAFLGAASLTVASDLLATLIKSTVFATANTEVRPTLTGIHVQSVADTLTFTATDGLRLATRSVKHATAQATEWDAVLPGKSLLELLKILPDEQLPVTIQFTSSHCLFAQATTLFYTRLIDGAYPDTSRIIPSDHRTQVVVDAELLMNAVDRAALIAPVRENHMVRLSVSDDALTIASSSPEVGNVSESLPIVAKQGEDLTIAFNARYVLDALRVCETPEVQVQFNGAQQPFVIRRQGQNDGLQLISPMLTR